MNNSEKYSNVFMKIFSIKKSKLNKLEYQSISQWDSVGHMSMIGKIEEVFKISIDINDIIDFSSFQKGKKILKKYKIKIDK
jgi:acyl carrier protein